jgi:hypothetical protein
MKRNRHLKELIDNIKQTEEMIALHKLNNTSPLMATQYESLKVKQIPELIDGLAMPPFQTIESISLIKHILNKYYPNIPEGKTRQKELKELEDAI